MIAAVRIFLSLMVGSAILSCLTLIACHYDYQIVEIEYSVLFEVCQQRKYKISYDFSVKRIGLILVQTENMILCNVIKSSAEGIRGVSRSADLCGTSGLAFGGRIDYD